MGSARRPFIGQGADLLLACSAEADITTGLVLERVFFPDGDFRRKSD